MKYSTIRIEGAILSADILGIPGKVYLSIQHKSHENT